MIDKLTMGLVQNTSPAVKDSITKKIAQCEKEMLDLLKTLD